MAEAESGMYDDFIQFYGETLGNAKYDVYRPDYTQIATPSTILLRSVWMRVDPHKGELPEPYMIGAAYYSVFTQRVLLPGDIINQTSPANIAVNQLTIQNVDDVKECVGFSSNYLGELATSSADVPYFTNVLFDYADDPGAGTVVIQGASEFQGEPVAPTKKIVLFKRAGVQIGHYIHDIGAAQWYKINAISYHLYTMELTVQADG